MARSMKPRPAYVQQFLSILVTVMGRLLLVAYLVYGVIDQASEPDPRYIALVVGAFVIGLPIVFYTLVRTFCP